METSTRRLIAIRCEIEAILLDTDRTEWSDERVDRYHQLVEQEAFVLDSPPQHGGRERSCHRGAELPVSHDMCTCWGSRP